MYDPYRIDGVCVAVLERAILDAALVDRWRARNAMRWLASPGACIFFDGMGLDQAEVLEKVREYARDRQDHDGRADRQPDHASAPGDG